MLETVRHPLWTAASVQPMAAPLLRCSTGALGATTMHLFLFARDHTKEERSIVGVGYRCHLPFSSHSVGQAGNILGAPAVASADTDGLTYVREVTRK